MVTKRFYPKREKMMRRWIDLLIPRRYSFDFKETVPTKHSSDEVVHEIDMRPHIHGKCGRRQLTLGSTKPSTSNRVTLVLTSRDKQEPRSKAPETILEIVCPTCYACFSDERNHREKIVDELVDLFVDILLAEEKRQGAYGKATVGFSGTGFDLRFSSGQDRKERKRGRDNNIHVDDDARQDLYQVTRALKSWLYLVMHCE